MTPVNERLSAALADRYRIESELGAGGMATVYLAHDARHDRKVALKVLRPELSAILGAERFLAEIKTTANLQHPHILGLFDSGEAAGNVFYVMPFVEGESLRDRLKRDHQLPVEEALRIAREVADALEYAHQHGIVHRDIKPENILLHGGHAVVADFGIALAASRSEGGSRMTETGMSLGTPHYMSPEQAMGEREITPKTDIYALGCVLYEMLTAEPPFVGATAQAIIGRVLTEEPRSLTAQRKTIPPHVEAAVQMALAKLPADRFASAKEFGDALGRSDFALPASTTRMSPAHGASTTKESRSWRKNIARAAPWVVALAAIALYAAERSRPANKAQPIARFALQLTPEVTTGQAWHPLALSPDGSRLVFVGSPAGGQQLFTRRLDAMDAVPIPGTENGISPFFSADGSMIAFVVGNRLMKVAVAGGPVLAICDVPTPFYGGTWNEGDTILFADDRGLHVVPSAGGQPSLIAAPDSGSGTTFRWPEFLPGGRTALFATLDTNVDRLAAITLGSREIRRYDVVGGNPHYVEQGHVVLSLIGQIGSTGLVTAGTLMSLQFDAGRLEALGDPVPVAGNVQMGPTSRVGKLAISRNGTIAFASGAFGSVSLVEIARDGSERDAGAAARFFGTPRLAPDGRRIALSVTETGATDIWTFDRIAKTLTRLTFDGAGSRPVWTRDGRRIAYSSGGDLNDISWIPADGSASAEALVGGPDDQFAGDFMPDDRSLVIREGGQTMRRRIVVVSLDSARTRRTLIESGFQNHSPSLSPDGRWVAYASDETGRTEIYVRPVSGPGGKWQVSKAGGLEPRWSPAGREIFFRAGPSMMAASVQGGATFVSGEVRELFKTDAAFGPNFPNYDVTKDGRTFIMFKPPPQSGQQVIVLLNWFDNLPAGPR